MLMDTYVGHRLGKLSPHIFAIAEEAFRNMQMQGKSQSILVSGESGRFLPSLLLLPSSILVIVV